MIVFKAQTCGGVKYSSRLFEPEHKIEIGGWIETSGAKEDFPSVFHFNLCLYYSTAVLYSLIYHLWVEKVTGRYPIPQRHCLTPSGQNDISLTVQSDLFFSVFLHSSLIFHYLVSIVLQSQMYPSALFPTHLK